MKKLLVLAMLVACVASARVWNVEPQAQTPGLDDVLAVDTNAAGHSITNIKTIIFNNGDRGGSLSCDTAETAPYALLWHTPNGKLGLWIGDYLHRFYLTNGVDSFAFEAHGIKPNASNTLDIGALTLPIRDIHFANSLNYRGTCIYSNGAFIGSGSFLSDISSVCTWTSTVNTAFGNSNNWSNGRIPVPGSIAIIPDTGAWPSSGVCTSALTVVYGTTRIQTGASIIGDVELHDSSSLQICTVYGNIRLFDTSFIANNAVVNGNAEFYNGSHLYIGTVQGSATFHDTSYAEQAAVVNGLTTFHDSSISYYGAGIGPKLYGGAIYASGASVMDGGTPLFGNSVYYYTNAWHWPDGSQFYSPTGRTLNAQLNATGSIVPTGSNTMDLGSLARPFRDAYIGPSSLYMGGQKVLSVTSGALRVETATNCLKALAGTTLYTHPLMLAADGSTLLGDFSYTENGSTGYVGRFELPGVTRITGSYQPSRLNDLTELSDSTINMVGGNVAPSNMTNATSLTLFALETVLGDFRPAWFPACTSFQADSLKTVGGNFAPSNFPNLGSLSFANLRTVGGNIQPTTMTNLTMVSFSGVTKVGGSVTLTNMAKITMFGFGGANCDVDGSFTLGGPMPSLGSLDLGNLHNVRSNLSINAIQNVTTVSLGNLTSVGGTFTLGGCTNYDSLNLTYLQDVGRLNLTNMPKTSILYMPSLVNVRSPIILSKVIGVSPSFGNLAEITLGGVGVTTNIGGPVLIVSNNLNMASVSNILAVLNSLDGTGGKQAWSNTVNFFGNSNATLASWGPEAYTWKTNIQNRGGTVTASP